MQLDEVIVTALKPFSFDPEAGKKVLFPKGYTDKALHYIDEIVRQSNLKGVEIKGQLAYMLATPYHETYDWNKGLRFEAMAEMGGDKYLKSKPYFPFYGRGPSHLTWKDNYAKEANRTGHNLVGNPDLMLDVEIGCESHVHCMIIGAYTGKKLSDYIDALGFDFEQARRIINGTDKADLIAGYAEEFLKCIV